MRMAWGVAVVAAALLYLLLWPHPPIIEGDSPQYLAVARDLADGRIDALHDRTPGYPALLALTGSTQTPTRLLLAVSLLLHAASVWMLASALLSCGVAPRWVLAFAAVLLLPPYVEPAAYVMTENLAQFLLVLSCSSLLAWFQRRRAWLLVLAALALTAVSLTRPIYQGLAPAMAVCLVVLATRIHPRRLTLRQSLAAGAALIAMCAILLGAYAYANRVKFGFFGVTHTLGFHLSTKTMAFVERLPDKDAVAREILVRERDAELTKRGGPHTGTQAIWSARDELAAAMKLSPPELSRYLLGMNLRLIARAPLEYLQEVGRSIGVYWLPAAGPIAAMGSGFLRWAWAILHLVLLAIFVLQLVVFTGATLLEWSKRLASRTRAGSAWPIHVTEVQAFAYALAGTIVFYTMLLSCLLDIGETRQRRSTDTLFVFMCFLGVHIWRQSVLRQTEAAVHDASLARE